MQFNTTYFWRIIAWDGQGDSTAGVERFFTTSEGWICGDANRDENINIFDITYIISYLYLSGPPPYPLESADINHDGAVNIFDITYLIAYLYLEGPDPACP